MLGLKSLTVTKNNWARHGRNGHGQDAVDRENQLPKVEKLSRAFHKQGILETPRVVIMQSLPPGSAFPSSFPSSSQKQSSKGRHLANPRRHGTLADISGLAEALRKAKPPVPGTGVKECLEWLQVNPACYKFTSGICVANLNL
jgi:hypothetical protein